MTLSVTIEQVNIANDNWDRLERTYNLDATLYCDIEYLKLPPDLTPIVAVADEPPEEDANEEKAIFMRLLKVLNDLEKR